jgi:hypothetical protein
MTINLHDYTLVGKRLDAPEEIEKAGQPRDNLGRFASGGGGGGAAGGSAGGAGGAAGGAPSGPSDRQDYNAAASDKAGAAANSISEKDHPEHEKEIKQAKEKIAEAKTAIDDGYDSGSQMAREYNNDAKAAIQSAGKTLISTGKPALVKVGEEIVAQGDKMVDMFGG